MAEVGTGVEVDDAAKRFANQFTAMLDGVGFGLSVSRTILAAHGGPIDGTPNSFHRILFARVSVTEAD